MTEHQRYALEVGLAWWCLILASLAAWAGILWLVGKMF